MPKVAVIFADGCEEIEGLSVVDVLRRLQVSCDMVGLDDIHVMGAHDIALTCDKVVGDDLLTYDMVVLPGGSGGAQRLRDSAQLQHLMQTRSEAGQWNAAMCAAPIALARYGLLTDTTFTMYPGMKDDIASETPGARFSEDMVVVDQDHKILTSRGPATALAFAFGIAEVLGVDPAPQKEAMLWNYLMK
ncbi:DJ-1 family glyoxalase III [Ligilactobacillus saerimneri]|uniref:Transcriptional regulator n=1 Tax=Ligilactobacillus saerimneri 30a TaxID=1227363 RepID=M5J7N2_9LACO|nr:DJ-1 family glyoxalase III [Ligilactobacillus saerimneri]EKW98864.1 transcriptional regulator [Ligilactobacillus saerimneri 30a]